LAGSFAEVVVDLICFGDAKSGVEGQGFVPVATSLLGFSGGVLASREPVQRVGEFVRCADSLASDAAGACCASACPRFRRAEFRLVR